MNAFNGQSAHYHTIISSITQRALDVTRKDDEREIVASTRLAHCQYLLYSTTDTRSDSANLAGVEGIFGRLGGSAGMR